MPKGKYWTEEEDEILLKRAGVATLPRIANELGRTVNACHGRLKRLGCVARQESGYLSAEEVAREYGCSKRRVVRLVRSKRLPARRILTTAGGQKRWLIDPADLPPVEHELLAPPKNWGLGNAKIDMETARKIRRDFPSKGYASLVAEYGLSRNSIWRIVTNRAWPEKRWYERDRAGSA